MEVRLPELLPHSTDSLWLGESEFRIVALAIWRCTITSCTVQCVFLLVCKTFFSLPSLVHLPPSHHLLYLRADISIEQQLANEEQMYQRAVCKHKAKVFAIYTVVLAFFICSIQHSPLNPTPPQYAHLILLTTSSL